MTAEESRRYTGELTVQFNRQGLQFFPVYDGGLPVKVNGMHLHATIPIGKTEHDLAMMSQVEKDSIVQKATNIIRTVKEYMALMETAPQIKARGLEGDYRVLAEFNSVVLAGHPTRYGVQFVTWEWVQDHTSLWQGHYTESYTAAKEDFATRSGLVEKERQFSDQQLAVIFDAVQHMMVLELTSNPKQDKLLEQIMAQIETSLPEVIDLANALTEDPKMHQLEQMDSIT